MCYSIGMSFEERFDKLNDEQKKAVKTTHGPVLVIAGPGSGKTEILSLRVAEILRRTDTSAGSILCLTFTDNASVNMRKRLSGLIGTDAYRVQIHTFHSFGVSIINHFPEYFFGSAEFNSADTITQMDTVSSILKELPHHSPFRSFHPEQGYVYLQSIIGAISNLKRAGLTPDEFEKILEHNELVLEYTNPLIGKVFTDRLSKKDFSSIRKTADVIKKGISKKFPVPHMKALSKTISDTLLDALSKAEDEDKTAPLSDWKSKWTEKNDDGERVLKDSERLYKMKELVSVYRTYQKSLYEKGYYDFDDMLLETIQAIEKTPSLALVLQEEFQYILVDEFQDTNEAQMRLIRLLTSADVHEGRPNIMAVGDDDQAIYKFQGAEVANILQFKEMYKNPTVITLTKNYRSTQGILDIASGIIKQGENSLSRLMPEVVKELKAENKKLPIGEIIYKNFRTNLHEYQYVASEITKRIKSGIKPDEIALISRTHSILQETIPFLRAEGIPVQYEKQQDVLELSYIRELLCVARFANSVAGKNMIEADDLLPEILSYGWWKLSREMIWKISIDALKGGMSWLETMRLHSDDKVRAIAGFLVSLGVSAQSEPLPRVLDLIIGSVTLELPDSEDDDRAYNTSDILELDGFKSPFREFYFGEKIIAQKGDYLTFLSGLRVFIQTLREYKQGSILKISDLVELVSVYEKNNMQMLDTSPFMSDTNAVRLLTSHKAKGLEFDVVFVLSATNDVWTGASRGDILPFPKNMPIKPSSDTRNDMLRLFYVALTRAKHTLYFTGYKQNSKGKSVLPIEFLADTTPDIDTPQTQVENSEERVLSPLERLSLPPFETNEKAMLQKLVEDYQMSITHLNNFLDVSKGGPHIFLEQNLLRFPQTKTVSSVYGTAMHSVMQYTYTYLRREGKVPELSRTFEVLHKQILMGRLNATDTRVQLERGEKAVKLYYELRSDRFDPEHKIEVDFKHQGVVLESKNSSESQARITGKIDKMVFLGGEVVVHDFKTGKPKLTWEDKDSFSAIQLHHYKNQLMFYKLLVENSKEFSNFKVNTGVLEYLEPYKESLIDLPLSIDTDEVLRLSNLAKIVYKKIISLDFPDTTKYSRDLAGCIEFEDDLLAGKI